MKKIILVRTLNIFSKRKNQTVFSTGVLTLILLTLGGCSSASTPSPTTIPPSPDPVSLVKSYEEAFNQHNLDTTMALFSDEAIDQWGTHYTAVLKQDVRSYHEFMFGLNSVLENTECTQSQDMVNCKSVLRFDCTDAAGMDGDHYTIDYTFENGKIYKITAVELPEDLNVLNTFMRQTSAWAEKNNLEGWKNSMGSMGSMGTLNILSESGQAWAKACQEYAATKP
jgi:hypothetical protein